ncbi:hypothetical protein E4T45_09612 [Aureobasidium sp. EXF-8846]|nr:hypothetical protein E4T45_09612 [Aureobasidium sp. EXF-8846]
MGRPRKRKLHDIEQSTSEPPQRIRQQTSSTESNPFDSAIEFETLTSDINFPGMNFPTSLDGINEANLLNASATEVPAVQSCACLSSIYLTLENLRGMDVLLGTLLHSMSERYGRVLKAIASDTTAAEQSGQTKTLQIGSLEATIPRHGNVGGIDLNEPLVLELPPLEWMKLAKRVVKAEIHGISDASRASFMSVLTSLEKRQAHWHTMEPTADCPNPDRRRHDMHDHNDNPMCLMLAREAKRLVDRFDFD